MAVSTLYFYQAALKAGPGKMKFEVISMMVTGIATVLYMTMFSGAGKSFVKELGHDINPHDTRDAFYWGRYVDWILTTPLMLWDVLALAGAPADDILAAVGVDVLMIGFGAVGAQTPSAQKWVFFVCGMICFGHIVKVLLKYTTVSTAGKEAQSLYCKVAYMTIVLWTLYPLVWIISASMGDSLSHLRLHNSIIFLFYNCNLLYFEKGNTNSICSLLTGTLVGLELSTFFDRSEDWTYVLFLPYFRDHVCVKYR